MLLLEAEVEKNAFTAWSFANEDYVASAFWANECLLEANRYHPVFDLASLTKPLFLNMYFMLTHDDKYFNFISRPFVNSILQTESMPISLKKFIESDSNLCLNSFLSHKSGLMAWSWMGHKTALEVTNYILSHKLNSQKNEIYSDLNYFILARIIESSNISWTEVLQKINTNLSTSFKHASLEQNEIVSVPFYPYNSSEGDNKSPSLEFGRAHDTNANIFSSYGKNNNIVSGHGGLFGNVVDIIHAVKYFAEFFYKQEKKNENRFMCGFDTPTSEHSTAGVHHFLQNRHKIFGHLGYSGTSFWLHPETKKYHILLTNRTAKRIHIGANICPRIYALENIKTKEIFFYSNEKKTFDEVGNITKTFAGKFKCIWNNKVIPDYKNISSIRKQIGLNLWDV